jgi:hypothetical protein
VCYDDDRPLDSSSCFALEAGLSILRQFSSARCVVSPCF